MVRHQFHQGFCPMSLQPQEQCTVPEEAAKVAHGILPRDTLCITLTDTLSKFVSDQDFSEIFATQGHPAESPWWLAVSHDFTVCRRLNRSADVWCCAQPHWLEIFALSGVDRCGFSSHRVEQVSHSLDLPPYIMTLLPDLILGLDPTAIKNHPKFSDLCDYRIFMS